MDEVDEIKQRLDVAEVVGGYVQLKQAGRNMKAPCPFHQEKSASFMVSPDKNIWHCFGCNEGGDIFTFIMKIEGLEFREALELLARRAGIELKSRQGSGHTQLKERLYSAHEWAVKYYQASLMKNPRALDYLNQKRHLNRQTIKDFQIGFAPDSWEGLTRFLIKKKFSEHELLEAGLAAKKRGAYDLFRGRIVLTICDASGRAVGFTGRVLDDSLPKYLNTPQTVLYDKGRVIYGLHLAKEAIRAADEAVLVEGNMDVVASHQTGIKQVVAVSGTALTFDQLKALSRLTKNIKLAFDQDKAGLLATERAIEMGQRLGLVLKMISTSPAKDPDELIQKDPQLWRQAIADAEDVMDYLIKRFQSDFNLESALGKRAYVARLGQFLRHFADVAQEHYVKQLSVMLDISADAIKQAVNSPAENLPAPKPAVKAPTAQTLPRKRDAKTVLEESVLAMALAFPSTRLALADLAPDDFSDESRKQLAAAIKAGGDKSSVELAETLPSGGDYAKILALRGEEEYADLAPADRSFEAFELARRLRNNSLKQVKHQIADQLRAAQESGDSKLALKLLQKYQALIQEEN